MSPLTDVKVPPFGFGIGRFIERQTNGDCFPLSIDSSILFNVAAEPGRIVDGV